MAGLCSSGLWEPHGEPQPTAQPTAERRSADRNRATHGGRGPAAPGERLLRGEKGRGEGKGEGGCAATSQQLRGAGPEQLSRKLLVWVTEVP